MALTGGQRLQEYLNKIAGNVAAAGSSPSVRVGFLEDALYGDGKSVAGIAAIQEFGGTIHKPPGQVTVFRKMNAAGTGFLRNGRFVKRRESNFSTTHATPAHSITIPPRPFFRNAIKRHGKEWGKDIAKLLKASDFRVASVLGTMGARIAGQIQQSIHDLTSPPLAASTVRRKGFSKPLIDTGYMWNSVGYEVSAE